ncbi:S-layer homology domain-containing protein [Demequina activiva]|uniref:SLH domain-containing protein n=1 Tax=Demequina activiva TaxID=1582364 RepID=A0A919Q0T1_9MICO|nr:S-layer homology domain-containing protein [Demequina activiva]GIG54210.1 hypothetical protein Dac01nite_09620 [Demequina activiva]
MRNTTARTVAGVSIAALAATLVGTAAQATSTEDASSVVFSSLPAEAPASYPSIGFNARSTLAVGDIVELAGANRMLDQIEVSLNSWACESGTGAECVSTPGSSYTHPVTATVYAVDGEGAAAAPSAVLAELTQDVDVPFRPSANAEECGEGASTWHDAALDTCQNGFSFPVTFDFSATATPLPDEVVVAFSTYTSKNSDLAKGPYDSLNIDLGDTSASVGTDSDIDSIVIDAYAPVGYNDDGEAGLGALRQDLGWTGYAPVFSISATPVPSIASTLIDFEDASDSASADGGLSGVSIVESTDELAAAGGCYYATAPVIEYNADVFTRFGGYASAFPAHGWFSSADFYFDTQSEAGQFQWSLGVNGTDGAHQRDFVFTVGTAGEGTWTAGASNNAANSTPFIGGYGEDPATITESGWYSLGASFYEQDGLLYVDMRVVDATDSVLKQWTLGGNAADTINVAVGGNRYGWLVNNSFEGLAIDNVLLNADRPAAGCEDDVTPTVYTSSFTDVPDTHPFYKHISWLSQSGITYGYANGGFGPSDEISRGQVAAFLYKMAGSPAWTPPAESPFADVSTSNVFYKHITWMANEGITYGVGDGSRFGVSNDLNRGQMAAFLYKLAGSPEYTPPATPTFDDVPTTHTFYKHIEWLAESGIASGYASGGYGPSDDVTRGQMAVFLFKLNGVLL